MRSVPYAPALRRPQCVWCDYSNLQRQRFSTYDFEVTAKFVGIIVISNERTLHKTQLIFFSSFTYHWWSVTNFVSVFLLPFSKLASRTGLLIRLVRWWFLLLLFQGQLFFWLNKIDENNAIAGRVHPTNVCHKFFIINVLPCNVRFEDVAHPSFSVVTWWWS